LQDTGYKNGIKNGIRMASLANGLQEAEKVHSGTVMTRPPHFEAALTHIDQLRGWWHGFEHRVSNNPNNTAATDNPGRGVGTGACLAVAASRVLLMLLLTAATTAGAATAAAAAAVADGMHLMIQDGWDPWS
jgi:hypothetical protein